MLFREDRRVDAPLAEHGAMSLNDAGLDERVTLASPDATDAVDETQPSISVIGLGPIGVDCIAGYAGKGYRVVGVDIDFAKVRALKDGQSPLGEQGATLIAAAARKGLVEATQNIVAAVIDTDVTMLPVSGSDMAFVRAASRAIGQALSLKDGYHAIVLTGFTDATGIVETVARECSTASGKRLGVDFGICISPDLWREELAGEVVPRPLIRASDSRAARLVEPLLSVAAE